MWAHSEIDGAPVREALCQDEQKRKENGVVKLYEKADGRRNKNVAAAGQLLCRALMAQRQT